MKNYRLARRSFFKSLSRTLLQTGVLFLSGLVTQAGFAQSENYTRIEVFAGVETQIGFNSAFAKDCSPIQLPPIHVIAPPQHGVLKLKDGIVTAKPDTPCANKKTSAQIIFFQPNETYRGLDEIIFETFNARRERVIYHLSVTVKERGAPKAKPLDQSL